MLKFVQERADRLHRICSKTTDDGRFPLVVEHKLSEGDFCALRNCLVNYLYDSVKLFHPKPYYELNHDFLWFHEKEIASLPNITPNGLLLPKKHNSLSYNLVYREVARLVKGFGIEDELTHVHHPVNVRIVNGKPNEVVDSRPKASVKLHSDIWAGEFTNHVMIFFPVFGDMENNGVELYEPGESFYPHFVKTLHDYSEGNELNKDAKKYDLVMKPGHVYFLDSFLLHKTVKNKAGLRLAVNFAFLTKEKLESDLPIETARHEEYIDKEEWFKYGSEKLLINSSEARVFTKEELNVSMNCYADKYHSIDLFPQGF
jgi:hypothetical protein